MITVGTKVRIRRTASMEEATYRGKTGKLVGYAKTGFGEYARVRMEGYPVDGLILTIHPESLEKAP